MNTPIIYAYLMDGNTHKVDEFYHEVARLINPARAIRVQKWAESTETGPLECKVAYGKMRIIKAMLYSLVRKDIILLDSSHIDVYQWNVMLTEKGLTEIGKCRGRNNGRGNRLWSAIRHLHNRGLVDLTFKPAVVPEAIPNNGGI